MNNRELLKHYVVHGGDKAICSPQIGAGAGFDTMLAGKRWISETTLEDLAAAWKRFDVVPLYNLGLPDLTQLVPDVETSAERHFEADKNRYVTDCRFCTPLGTLTSLLVEHEIDGVSQTKYLIVDEDELEILEIYLDRLLEVEGFSPITRGVREQREAVGEDVAMDIQWAMQPYELLCFPNTVDTAVFAMTCPEIFTRLMEKILRLNEKLIPAVAAGGSDFVFLGGPGSEMISPDYYERFLVPYSKILSEMAHQNGLLIYSHICSPIEPMLTMGYYNQMGIDLFETLSQAPVGNVASIGDAFGKLDERICTRGNIGLDRLLNATPEEIREESLAILETAKRMGRKHILAASDYMFYQTKVENVQAMVDACAEFNAR
ncbi:MAG: uroporphyrinogen decarboxylase family protein [Oscillospiraceae bacterium]